MGLDAVVFRNSHSLGAIYGGDLFNSDQTTGEAIPKPSVNLKIPRDVLIRIEIRLGNLDEIAMLREAVMDICDGRESFILGKVLYSGSHSGDAIETDQCETLLAAIADLRQHNCPELSQLLIDLESLVAAGKAEQNPIVFV